MLFYINEDTDFENDGLDNFYNEKFEDKLTEKEQYRHDYWIYIDDEEFDFEN